MPSWLYYGKKGNGKGVLAIKRIQHYLMQNRPVATNLNINLQHMLPHHAKQCQLYRLPDYPQATDLWAIGIGNKSMGSVTYDNAGNVLYENPIYDEEQNGLIVLDELSTFLNAREWKGNARQEFLDYLIHTRKLGWDTLFIAQDIVQIDAQIRKSQIEQTVMCIGSHNFHMPYLTRLFKLFRLHKFFPKFFTGYVRYGMNTNASVMEKIKAVGTKSVYLSYDTRQIFIEGTLTTTPQGQSVMIPTPALHSVLPPFYTHGRYTVTLPPWARYTVLASLAAGAIYFGHTVYTAIGHPNDKPQQTTAEVEPETEQPTALQQPPEPTETPITSLFTYPDGTAATIVNRKTIVLQGYQLDENNNYIFSDADGNRYRLRGTASNRPAAVNPTGANRNHELPASTAAGSSSGRL